MPQLLQQPRRNSRTSANVAEGRAPVEIRRLAEVAHSHAHVRPLVWVREGIAGHRTPSRCHQRRSSPSSRKHRTGSRRCTEGCLSRPPPESICMDAPVCPAGSDGGDIVSSVCVCVCSTVSPHVDRMRTSYLSASKELVRCPSLATMVVAFEIAPDGWSGVLGSDATPVWCRSSFERRL